MIFPQGANRNAYTANPGVFLKETHPEFAALFPAFLCIKEDITVCVNIPELTVRSQGRAFYHANITFPATAGINRYPGFQDVYFEKYTGKP